MAAGEQRAGELEQLALFPLGLRVSSKHSKYQLVVREVAAGEQQAGELEQLRGLAPRVAVEHHAAHDPALRVEEAEGLLCARA